MDVPPGAHIHLGKAVTSKAQRSPDGTRAVVVSSVKPNVGRVLEVLEESAFPFVFEAHLRGTPLDDLHRLSITQPVSNLKRKALVKVWEMCSEKVIALKAELLKARIARTEIAQKLGRAYGRERFLLSSGRYASIRRRKKDRFAVVREPKT